MKSTRRYVQGRRADASAATAARILSAATELFLESGQEPTLDAVAARAEVAVQTVLRRFGSKDGLFTACVEAGSREVAAQRAVRPGDVPGAIDNLLEHYDTWGERSLRLSSLEGAGPAAARVVASAREVHRTWVTTTFEPQLRAVPPEVRRVRTAQLVAVTDVYTWKVLVQQLSRAETRAALLDLVERLLHAPGASP
jgi:AcrR family transcriptional regulator